MVCQLREDAGELDNTLVIVTSDNGMPFPRAKANLYEDGIHVPLAIRWASRVAPGRVVDLVGGVDLTATILDAAEVGPGSGGRQAPAEELFDIQQDPDCVESLAGRPELEQVRAELWHTLETYLKQTCDPRVGPNGDIWETYPRLVGVMRKFPQE